MIITAHHGSPNRAFTEFHPEYNWTDNDSSVAMWFSDHAEMVKKYYAVPGGCLIKAKLTFINPLIIDAHNDAWNTITLPASLLNKGINVYWNYLERKYVDSKRASTENLAVYAKKNGYDGLIISNLREGHIDEYPSTAYAIFKDDQWEVIESMEIK